MAMLRNARDMNYFQKMVWIRKGAEKEKQKDSGNLKVYHNHPIFSMKIQIFQRFSAGDLPVHIAPNCGPNFDLSALGVAHPVSRLKKRLYKTLL